MRVDVFTIALPWPDKALSPNGRPNRYEKARAIRAAKSLAYWSTKEQLGRRKCHCVHDITVQWCPPDRRSRDDDNLIASFKAYRDGIAAALGVDDKGFQPHHNPNGPIMQKGMVKVSITIEVPA